MKKIAFTGGGSAGHVVPNIALIRELQKTGEADLCYFGSNGIEKRLIAPTGIPYFSYDPPKFKRGLSFDALKNNVRIPAAFRKAVARAEEGLKAFQPDLIFSKGGFVALPVVFAGKKLHIPCLTHESDFSLGLANRLMAKKCEHVLTAFPETAGKIKNGKYVGAPVREELFGRSKSASKRALCGGTARKTVLVFGGGSGSEALNRAVRKAVPELCKKYFVLHVCGKGNVIETNLKNYRQEEYIDDMGSAYACADLVVCRAGAGAIFELLALRKPAVLVPLEGQTRGDQLQNAEYFREKGLCRVLRQADLDFLETEIERALRDERLKQNLCANTFAVGNANVLYEIRRYLV